MGMKIKEFSYDLPGGIMKVTRGTVERKNYAGFEERMQSLGYKITIF